MSEIPGDDHLRWAHESIAAAIEALQRAQEVRWRSSLARRYRAELYGAIQDVRSLSHRIDDAREAWARLRALETWAAS